MKKIDHAKNMVFKNIEIFSCPICGKSMNVVDKTNRLVCSLNHSFDFARNGYLNLLINNSHNEYDKEMFEARNIVYKSGFFNKAITLLSETILNLTHDMLEKDMLILDTGCGEGSHFSEIFKILNNNPPISYRGIGMDISKEAIYIAAREYAEIIWTVGDLSKCPFNDNMFNIILNIFTPSNYSEFKRLLKKDGILIKVVPGSNYIKELREIFYSKTSKEYYSNDNIVNHFKNNFNSYKIKDLSYKHPTTKELMPYLIKMTPLTWGIDKDKIEEALNSDIDEITVDLTIIIGIR